MKTKMKALIAALTLTLMLPFMMIPASATPAADKSWYYRGDNAVGISNITEDSPIVIEHQDITFNIIDYPEYDRNDLEPITSYRSNVVTEYTLLNPTSDSATVTVAFPASMRAGYGKTDSSLVDLKLNGEAVECETKYLAERAYLTQPLDLEIDVLVDIGENIENGTHYIPWHIYSVILEPGERAKLSLTTPILPTGHYAYEPETHEYRYIFSPYHQWAGYGSTDITVKTDYYMLNSDHISTERTDEGYTAHIDSLHVEIDEYLSGTYTELYFTLCSSESAERIESTKSFCNNGMIILLPFIFIIAGISAVVDFVGGIFEAIGNVFEAIGSGISWIIEQFK